MKPWIKANNGRLYTDTSDPRWLAWFKAELTRIQNSNFYKNLKKRS